MVWGRSEVQFGRQTFHICCSKTIDSYVIYGKSGHNSATNEEKNGYIMQSMSLI